jgi:hypothetical protein
MWKYYPFLGHFYFYIKNLDCWTITKHKITSYFLLRVFQSFGHCLRQQPLNAVSLCVLIVASLNILRFTTDVILLDMLKVTDPCIYEKVCVWGLRTFQEIMDCKLMMIRNRNFLTSLDE